MFLDEELEKIYQEGGFNSETSKKLLKACFERLEKTPLNPKVFLPALKRTNRSWEIFCERHPEFNKDGFKKIMTQKVGMPESIKKHMNW